MEWLEFFSADKLALSFLAIFTLRQSMITCLPDTVAGPGGWLVDTDPED